eukprot:TRINITY_DN8164_c0_g1_i2.p1 TRINITY_DN8164_c0_g1~~TRINITY_DN8164_c0_g1_i2.p1  ORF type:complete len:252 (-),score=22.22 TRINITY_DN8164_c0_g1_i2:90-845(-)
METFRKISGSEFYRKFLVHGVRPDGRNLSKIRKTSITTGSITTADGSSFVKVGQTSVCCGIVGEVGLATEKTKSGQVVVNVELTPICSTRFRPGKPTEEAQVLATFFNDLVSNPKHPLVSFENLRIEDNRSSSDAMSDDETNGSSSSKEKLVWYLYADIYCMNHDGNVQDICLIALLAALKNLKLPTLVIPAEGKAFIKGKPQHALSILHHPVSLTFGILEEFVLADPTSEEEDLSNGQKESLKKIILISR